MDFQGSQLLNHPAQTVWQALMDPVVLQQCIAGCEKFEHLGGDDYSSTVKVTIGPVSARFTSKVSLTDRVVPKSCALHFSGQGGVAGFGKGVAKLQLTEVEGSKTQLDWTAQAQVGGKLAQIGSRLLEGSVRKMSDDFFTRLTAYLDVPETVTGQAPTAVPPVAGASMPVHWAWLAGGAALLLACAWMVWSR
jgi:carbon monoxide dehydrogenase subunit G